MLKRSSRPLAAPLVRSKPLAHCGAHKRSRCGVHTDVVVHAGFVVCTGAVIHTVSVGYTGIV
eukprot:3453834-Pyramimonas_sp.AAC.1